MKSKKEKISRNKREEIEMSIPLIPIKKREDILQIGMSNQVHYDTASLLQDNNSKKIIATVGLLYFGIFNKYKLVSPALGSKLALAHCCQQFKILFGYAISFH